MHCISTSHRWAWAAALLVLCLSAPLAAQTGSSQPAPAGSPRPFRGIFGGSNPNDDGGLDLQVSLSGAYDDDVTGRSTNASSAQHVATMGGYYGVAGVDLNYERPGDHVTIAASGHSNASYYPKLSDLSGFSHFGDGMMALSFGGFRASVLQSVAKSPFYSFVPVPLLIEPGTLPPEDPLIQLNVVRRDNLSYQTRLSASQQLTTRTSISATAGYRKASYSINLPDLSSYSAGARISRNFTKNLALSAGYAFSEAHYAQGRITRTRDINIGTDYDRPLSRSRRTFVSFSTGTSRLEDQRGQSYRLTGAAGLRHQMGRSWSTSVDYNRGVRYLEGFEDAFLSDSVRAAIQGFLTRRLDANVQLGYTTGTIGFTANAIGFSSYFGTASLRYALTRMVAINGNYLFYHYDFDREPTSDLPSRFDRNGVRVGVTVWVPLF